MNRWDLIKLAAAPLALKCLRMLLTNIGTAVTTWLVARHLVSTGDQLTYVNLLADCAPALAGMLPGFLLQIWIWLHTFKWVTDVETALHLPATGRKLPATIAVARDAKDTANASLAVFTSLPLDKPMFTPPANPPAQ